MVAAVFACVIPGRGTSADTVVVGAHYDSALGTPGANDNGSGVAALLAIARQATRARPETELRLAWFTNEEPPHFQKPDMGSLRYARLLEGEGRRVVAMLSLETIGYYSEQSGSQRYPDAVTGFFPSTGKALNANAPGVGWSDHWSFWQIQAPAIMVTDTALFRYQHYHRPSDTPDRIDYARLARVTLGVERVVRALVERAGS